MVLGRGAINIGSGVPGAEGQEVDLCVGDPLGQRGLPGEDTGFG